MNAKSFVRVAVMCLAAVAACLTRPALAEDLHFVSGDCQPTTSACATGGVAQPVANDSSTCCSSCQASTCDGCCGPCDEACCPGCDECPTWGLLGFAGLDSFKGVSDGSFESNFGAVMGLNAAIPVPGLVDHGIGWQLGLSYGVYDFDGWGNEVNARRSSSQHQTFITTGFFHKADCDQRLSYGVVYDWMLNTNWGEFVGDNPTLGQWRGQIEYSVSCCNALGVWGTLRDRASHHELDDPVPLDNRPISQLNFFWHHKFCTGADSYLWFGFPQTDRLAGTFSNGGHSLGTWMVGANVQAPLSDRLALYANGSYFRPSASSGPIAAMESGYDVGMGVVWYFGRNAISHSLNGKCWLPYMPMANNSNFLVDQSDNY